VTCARADLSFAFHSCAFYECEKQGLSGNPVSPSSHAQAGLLACAEAAPLPLLPHLSCRKVLLLRPFWVPLPGWTDEIITRISSPHPRTATIPGPFQPPSSAQGAIKRGHAAQCLHRSPPAGADEWDRLNTFTGGVSPRTVCGGGHKSASGCRRAGASAAAAQRGHETLRTIVAAAAAAAAAVAIRGRPLVSAQGLAEGFYGCQVPDAP
jgi:hypothetical protein